MKRFKITWRMNSLDALDEHGFNEMLDIMTKDGTIADEFWLFISEPTSYCYEPLETIAKRCEIYKQGAALAKARGIRVGINPWPTFGADETYQQDLYKREMPFQPMVGYDGSVSRRLACPFSREFLDYSRARYKLFAQTGASFAWVDDDCRLTHLGGVPYPCFCDRCVKGFGYSDRETLVADLNKPENRALRHDWSAYGAKRLATYCAELREAVDEVDPAVETPFMSVGYSHTTFSGDYIEQCMKALRAKSARPGHGFYWDEAPMEMFEKTYEMSRQIVSMPEAVLDDVQYEEESCPCTILNKAPDTRIIEAMLAIWGGCTGIAMNHMHGDGGDHPYNWFKYEADLLRQNRPLFDRYLTFIEGLPQLGVWAAYSEWMASAMKVDERGWFRENDRAYYANKFVNEWPCFGIPVTADPSGAYATLFQGKIVEAFSDEELNRMLEKPVFMDGEALEALWARGFGEKTGVRIKRAHTGGSEKIATGDFAGATRNSIAGLAYDLEPICEGVEVLAYTKRPYGTPDEPCATRFGNIVVLGFAPYKYTGTSGHLKMMRDLEFAFGAPVVLEPADVYNPPRVGAWARGNENRGAVLLINGETSPAFDFDVCYKGSAQTATLYGLNGKEIQLTVRHENGYTRASVEKLLPWETALVLFE